jgi:rhodanese-related sulfurtransferase
MDVDPSEIGRNRDYFAAKLRAEKQRNDVLKAIEGEGPYDFVLLDTRGKDAFTEGHIPGAWCISGDVSEMAARLPKDKEIVTYCWGRD